MKPFTRAIVIFLIFFAVLYLLTHLLPERKFIPNSDEGYYYKYAQAVSQKGPGAFKEMLEWYSAGQEARLHPPPFRFGYVLTGALLFKIFGHSYWVLGAFSAACFLVFLGVTFVFCRRYFGLDTALLTSLLLSSSPLLLAMARRSLTESPFNLLGALTTWSLLAFLMERKQWQFGLFLLAFVAAMLFKESSSVFLPFCLGAMLLSGRLGMAQVPFKYPLITVLVVLSVPSLIAVLILGGGEPFFRALWCLRDIQLHIKQFNSYVLLYSCGPWFSYVLDFLLLSPILVLLCIGYAFHFLLSKSKAGPACFFILYVLVFYASLVLLGNNTNVRYAITLETPLALLAVLGLAEMAKKFRHGLTLMVVAAATIYFLNLMSFTTLFEVHQIYDPTTYNLLTARYAN